MRKIALALTLAFAALPAAAATTIGISALVNFVIWLIIIGIILGILIFLVNRAPFLPAEGKALIVYVIYVVAAIAVIVFLLGLAGGSQPISFVR